MREGWRKAWIAWGIVLLGTTAVAAPPEPSGAGASVRLTVQVEWILPDLPALPEAPDPDGVLLEMSEGRVVEALAWPGASAGGPSPRPDGIWTLGESLTGRARARVEAPIGASLKVHAGGQTFAFPLVALLEGPQRTSPQAPADLRVERLPWDGLEVMHDGDGTAVPGGSWALSVGFNVLAPMRTEVNLHFSAELRPARGGSVLWQAERSEVIATNTPRPPSLALAVPAPRAEGTYLLEVRSTWEPIDGRDGTRLGRWLKRRRAPAPATTTRRVLLTVRGTGPPSSAPSQGGDSTVDAIDLARVRANRPSASGRAPLDPGLERASWSVPDAALVGPQRGDRLRGLIARGGSENAVLGPAETAGLSWSSFGLHLAHPGRPHRLTLTVAGGPSRALGVALIAQCGPGRPPRVLLDACASGEPAEGGAPASFSWLVWPDVADPVLVLFNRAPDASVRLGSVELIELAGDPPPPPMAATHPDAPRTVSLHLGAPAELDRFGGHLDGGPVDFQEAARNLAGYVAHCGATALVLPEGLAERPRRLALDGQADEDATGPDRLDAVLAALGRRGMSAWLEVGFDGPLPGLPAPDSPEALARGLIRVDGRGQADGPAYQPLRTEVRDAMRKRVEEAIAPRRSHPNVAGVLIRLGPGCTLPGGPDTGLDDGTFARFVRTLRPEAAREVPGLAGADPARFAARRRFLEGNGGSSWLTWRTREVGLLYGDLARTVASASPGALLAVVTPGLDDGPAGSEARRHDQLGRPFDRAWRAVGLDLRQWPPDPSLLVLRGVDADGPGLAHDLGVDPDLDAQVSGRPGRGLALLAVGPTGGPRPPAEADADPVQLRSRIDGLDEEEDGQGRARSTGPRLSAFPMPDGPAGDEPLGHALAVLDARWVVLGASVFSGREERARRFARVFRGLPSPSETAPPSPRPAAGVAARSWSRGKWTYLALANDTPYRLFLETTLPIGPDVTVDDLGRMLHLMPRAAPDGGRQLVVELAPFGVAAVRVGRPGVSAERLKPHFQDGPQAQAAALRDLVGRLGQGGVLSGPPNPGFEPAGPPTAEIRPARAPAPAEGWTAGDDPANSVAIDADRPHSGRGSLRLDTKALPASAVGDWFLPPSGEALTLQAWLRADRSDSRVRVWLDGIAAGKALSRHRDLTAGADWTRATLPFADLPAGGLERARLRFEPLAAGRLWIDDLALTGRGPSEPERRAQVVLWAAIQAYDEGRFADFARLAASHRARLPDPSALAGRPEPIRTGEASDLPRGRRLR